MPPPSSAATSIPPARSARARLARAAALTEQGFDATCVWVLDGTVPGVVVDWPAAAEQLYGLGAGAVLGRPRHEPVRTLPCGITWSGVLDALNATGRWEGELAHEVPGIGRVLTDTRLLVVAPADEHERADEALVVEIARDVTARRVAEEALIASQNRLAAVFASALDAIVTVDEAQRVVLFNGAAERLFGVPAADALGAPLDRFIPPRFRASHRGFVAGFGTGSVAARHMSPGRDAASPATGDGERDAGSHGVGDRAERPGTVLALHADGTEFPIEAAISQVETPDGRLYTVIVRDVSERVRIESERERLVAALEAERARLAESARAAEAARAEAVAARLDAETASRAKSAFLATMSHELRTPLNAVLGYAELLDLGLAGAMTDPQRRYLERIAASGRHLLGLMDDLLDLSRIEAGKMHVARRRSGSRAAVRGALGLVRPQAAERGITLADLECGITLDANASAEEGPAYLGDEDRVRQILVNLLSNAVKFTDPGGRVTVSCATAASRPASGRTGGARPGPWVAIRVADTGIGIPAEHHEIVFARFQQVDREAAGPYRRTQGGTGLGLAISRELARLMGGDLSVDSEPGRGSTFTLWLPAADAPAVAPPTSDPSASRPTVGPLLADAARHVIDAWVGRLRADPLVPHASELSRTELEDHMAGFLADFAQQFVILDDAGAPGTARLVLVRDGAELREHMSRCHGVQRARLGWNEAALAREFAVLGEELERVLVTRLADVPTGTVDDARTLVRTWLAGAARQSIAAMRDGRHATTGASG